MEVYFENVGWVPFEPTKGFVNPYEFKVDQLSTGLTDELQAGKVEKIQAPYKQDTKKIGKNPSIKESSNENLTSVFVLTFISVLCLLVGVFLYKRRKKWWSYILIKRYKNKKDDEVFFEAYESLLELLERVGIERKVNQTLREYAIHVDQILKTNDMSDLTTNYERVLYRRGPEKEEWIKSIELWENLIKRTSS